MKKPSRYSRFVEEGISRWSVLNGLGQSRWMRTSYFWFLFVPIAAKAVDWSVRIGETQLSFDVNLPFSWRVFYFSAVAFALASFLYQVFCPGFVRDYASFADFAEQGKGDRQLGEYVLNIIQQSDDQLVHPQTRAFLGEFLMSATDPKEVWDALPNERNLADVRRTLSGIRISEDQMPDAFWLAHSYADRRKPLLRALCTALYGIGFALLVYVMIQNIIFVFRVPIR
jgi:hypothetical protein